MTEQNQAKAESGPEKAEKPEQEKALSEIEDPEERKLERLKREYEPIK